MVRRFLQVITLVASLIVGAAAAAIIVSQTAWFKDWLRGFIVGQANGYLEGRLSIARLGGSLFSGVELEGVTLTEGGRPAVEVKDIGLDYTLAQLVTGNITLDDIRLNQPVVYLRRTEEGWNLARLVKRQATEADRKGPDRPIEIGSIGISNGTLVVEDETRPVGTAGTTGATGRKVPSRIERLDLKAGFAYSPVRYTVDIEHVSFEASDPALALRSLSGRVATEGDAVYLDTLAIRTAESALSIDGVVRNYTSRPVLELQASSEKLTVAEIARFVPAAAGIRIQPSFDIKATGPLDRLRVVATTKSSAGTIGADIVADVAAPGRRIAGTIDLAHFDLSPLVRGGGTRSDITGTADVDLTFVDAPRGRPLGFIQGTYRTRAARVAIAGYDVRDVRAAGRIANGVVVVDARAAAYGGTATVRGEIEPGRPLRLDIAGRAQGLDLRRLPPALKAPRMDTDIAAVYRVAGSFGLQGRLDVRAELEPSTIAGARFAHGTTANVTLDRGSLAYDATGRVEGLDVQRIGQGLDSPTLSADRFRSSLTGAFSVRGAGRSLATLSLDARADLERSSLFGGTLPSMRLTAAIADGGLRATANGSFSGFDPATVAGQPSVAGRVSGTAAVTVSLPQLGAALSPTSIGAAGRLTLAESEVAGIAITSAEIDGRFEHGVGDITALRVTGPDGTVAADGHLDLTGATPTDLAYDLQLPALDAVGKRLGRNDLAGSAAAKGRVTGTGRDLATTGDLTLSSLRVPGASLLAATSRYEVRLPGMDPARVEAVADTNATLVEAAGMKLTEVRARTAWREQVLDLDATLRDQTRTLDVAGDLVLHTDHQEVHLRNLALSTNGVEWRTEPGRESAIQYANGRIAVDRLALVSGASRIDAAGAFGRPDDVLEVKATAVDLATVDRLALGTGSLSGSLDASATVGGTREAMRADATVSIANGAFRGFRFAGFGATLGYDPSGVRVDARLDQAPGAWLAAKGVVPAAAMRPAAEGATPGTHEDPGQGQGMDVSVTTSALDLAIVQGFVPQVTKTSGTVQADVRVLGSVRDPHLSGHVDVRGGAFTIEALAEGGYTGLDTRITFEPDRVRIGELRILDEHGNPLRISGELAVHSRTVGEVQIGIESTNFEVIDNQLADVALSTDLRVTGELAAPRVVGTVSVDEGTVNVDRILETFTTGAYSETPTALPGQDAAAPGSDSPGASAAGTPPAPAASASPPPADAPGAAAARPTGFDAVALDVTLRVPDNLVVKGSDINPGSSPVSLGDVNVTLGGELRASKRPAAPVQLIGTVNTVRGTYDFQGRRFEIARDGRIQFVGGAQLDPRLDITATRVISGVRAQVHVRGSARRPQLELTSQPPLDEADILSLIVFNQPANALGEGEQASLATRAGALASGFVASTLAQSIGQALELDVFEVQTTPEDGAGPSVTIGEQVGERLFFKFRQAFGAQSVSELILEYQLTPYLRLQTSVAEGAAATERTLVQRVEQGGVDLIFYYAY